MLLSGERSKGGPGVRRSLALLIGRLLICLLFLFVGWTQVLFLPPSRNLSVLQATLNIQLAFKVSCRHAFVEQMCQ